MLLFFMPSPNPTNQIDGSHISGLKKNSKQQYMKLYKSLTNFRLFKIQKLLWFKSKELLQLKLQLATTI